MVVKNGQEEENKEESTSSIANSAIGSIIELIHSSQDIITYSSALEFYEGIDDDYDCEDEKEPYGG